MNKDHFAITRDGLSQAERWLDTIVPSYVQIDSREIPDFIEFLFELSKRINYYNEQNKISGNWGDFFTSDTNIIIILLSRFDSADIDIRYAEKKDAIKMAKTIDDAEIKLSEYLIFINEFYSKMSVALNRFENSPNTPETETMIYLFRGIENVGATIYSFYTQALTLFSGVKSEQLDKGLNDFKGKIDDAMTFFDLNIINPLEIISSSVVHLNDAFEQLMSRLARLSRAAKKFVEERRFMEHEYQPQVGLLITFLELYQYVKRRLNGLVEKHLDYYYLEVLGIKFEERQPDYVHVVAELEDQAARISIDPNNLLLAEVKSETAHYKPERSQVLSRARIKSLKTIFLSDYKQIRSPSTSFRDIKEIQVFKAEHPLFNPTEFIKTNGELKSWAVMGEDQHDRANSERTMLTSDLGIAVISPLFYQVEGKRKFTLTIELKSVEYPGLKEYLNNYVAVTKNMSRETVEHKLFSKAFILFYSAEDRWEVVQNYSIKIYDTNQPIAKLIVTFTLSNSEKAFDCYNEDIHKDSINSKLPVLKLLLNQNVEHFAFSFLRSVQLNRITINVSVTGFRAVKLQNNVGALSTAAPFQAFGPQPSIGSFLDIKNTNIFNRYLKDFSLKVNWLELPRGKAGFAKYYDGYGIKLTNDTFKVNLSSLTGGKYIPDSSIRQQFRLFDSDSQTEELNERSTFDQIDFKKIIFQNEPQLKNEIDFNEPFFKEGAIRLELCAPVEAFGHRLFPQIFPDVILNNSKKFRKRLAVPNQPYIPIVKTIDLDFELEFSEGLREGQVKDQHFQLFHLYPFGNQKIFPGIEKKNYWLMPQFDNFSNLLIGLENVEPNTELSLFFQMEEKTFRDTMQDPEPVGWSFLESNEWVEFNMRDIISNTTGYFANSGIVCLKMPPEIPVKNSILPGGIFWIRASSAGSHGLPGRVKSIMVNGILASRVVQENSANKLEFIEGSSIKGFSQTIKGIQNVFQLFPSFGGIAAETNNSYYVRVSERLRHKNRPVQIRDLAQTILKQFVNILIVKIFNCKRENFYVKPGVDLYIVLIPRELENGKLKTEQPKVSLSELYNIKTFVSSIVSPFVKFEVGNAIYERVKVICKVLFHERIETNTSVLRQKFISDINRYIAPWFKEDNTNINIGSKIFKAELLVYLKNLPYVSYIGSFSVVQFTSESMVNGDESIAQVEDSAVKSIDIIQGSTPTSVLIPSPFHIIEVLKNVEYGMPEASGIGNFIIGEEFLVTQEIEKTNPGTTEIDDDDSFGVVISHNI